MPRWGNFGILNSLTPRRKISPVIWSAQPAALIFLKVYLLDWLILILSCVKPNDRPVREVERPSRITRNLARDPTFLLHASALCNFFRSIQVWDFFSDFRIFTRQAQKPEKRNLKAFFRVGTPKRHGEWWWWCCCSPIHSARWFYVIFKSWISFNFPFLPSTTSAQALHLFLSLLWHTLKFLYWYISFFQPSTLSLAQRNSVETWEIRSSRLAVTMTRNAVLRRNVVCLVRCWLYW